MFSRISSASGGSSIRAAAIAGVIAAIAAACSEPIAPGDGVVWHVAGHSGAGRPAVDASTVYFVAAADSHVVHAFDRVDGKPRWTASTGVTGAGTFSQNGCMLAGQIVACGDGTDMVGLSTTDGHLIWSFSPTNGRFPGVYISTMDSARATIYAPSPLNVVHAIDVATGQARWSVPVIPGATGVTPYKVVDGGDLVFAPFTLFANPNTGGVVALSKVDGSTRWLKQFSHPDSASGAKDIALWSNLVLVSLENGRIEALDRATGAVAWELPGAGTYPSWQAAHGPIGFDSRTLVVAGNTLTAISVSGWVVSYDLTTHTELGRATVLHSAGSPWAASSDGTHGYFTSTSEFLLAFDPLTSAPVVQASGLFAFITAPTLTSDRIFIGSVDGYYAFKR